MSQQQPQYRTTADPIVRSYLARAELGVSLSTWHRWAREGRITLRKIGPRASGILRSELDAIKAGKAA